MHTFIIDCPVLFACYSAPDFPVISFPTSSSIIENILNEIILANNIALKQELNNIDIPKNEFVKVFLVHSELILEYVSI